MIEIRVFYFISITQKAFARLSYRDKKHYMDYNKNCFRYGFWLVLYSAILKHSGAVICSLAGDNSTKFCLNAFYAILLPPGSIEVAQCKIHDNTSLY